MILGAGAAGLAAAHELTANGQSVLVLEARARIGGRILTDSSMTGLGAPVELGAEFIHGRSVAVLSTTRCISPERPATSTARPARLAAP